MANNNYANRQANPALHSCSLRLNESAEIACFAEHLHTLGPRALRAFIAEIACGASVADAMQAYGEINHKTYALILSRGLIGGASWQ